MSVLTDLKNRGVKDVFFLVCDGLKGLPEVVGMCGRWLSSRPALSISSAIRSGSLPGGIPTRSSGTSSRSILRPPPRRLPRRWMNSIQKWGDKYAAMIRLWPNAWNDFIPFLDYDTEIRTVICSTNAIESLNARYRRTVRARGHFPSEQAALKCLYLVTRSLDPTGTGRTRWTMRWKPVINVFAITFGDSLAGRRDLLTSHAGNTVRATASIALPTSTASPGGSMTRATTSSCWATCATSR